jgi:hypothetical protein
MKKLILATLVGAFASIVVHADLATPISAAHIDVDSNLVWLDSSDTMRAFGDFCATDSLTKEARQASQDNLQEGFVQIAKIKLPATDETGMGLPECAYVFVRQLQLR